MDRQDQEDTKAYRIRKVAVIGEGKMGTGIFNYLFDRGLDLVWICNRDTDPEKLKLQTERRLKRVEVTHSFDNTYIQNSGSFCISNDLQMIENCDLIIEAIPESKAMKRALFLAIDSIAKPDAIVTTNTASIPLSEVAPAGEREYFFSGLHFFFPVALRNIVEIHRGEHTSQKSIDRLCSFLEEIQRRYILLEPAHAFLLNRILLEVQNEAWLLVENKACTIAQMDHLVKTNLFPFGIFDFIDSLGIDTMHQAILNYTGGSVQRNYYASFTRRLEQLVHEGKLGVKSGEGFYRYPVMDMPAQDPQDSVKITGHLRQTWISASKRLSARTGLTIAEANYAIREFFDLPTGPFE